MKDVEIREAHYWQGDYILGTEFRDFYNVHIID